MFCSFYSMRDFSDNENSLIMFAAQGWYKLTDSVFLDYLSQDIKMTNSSAVWRYLIAYKNLLRSIENIGIAVVYGIRCFRRNYNRIVFLTCL